MTTNTPEQTLYINLKTQQTSLNKTSKQHTENPDSFATFKVFSHAILITTNSLFSYLPKQSKIKLSILIPANIFKRKLARNSACTHLREPPCCILQRNRDQAAVLLLDGQEGAGGALELTGEEAGQQNGRLFSPLI